MSMWYLNILGTWIEVLNQFENLLFEERDHTNVIIGLI